MFDHDPSLRAVLFGFPFTVSDAKERVCFHLPPHAPQS